MESLQLQATRAIEAFEKIQPGQPYAKAHDAAFEAVLAFADPARAALFPGFTLPDARICALVEFAEGQWNRTRYVEELAELHANLIGSDVDASFLRSRLVLDRVRAAAKSLSGDPAEAEARADEHERRYVVALLQQLVGFEGYEPFATDLAVTVPALEARIAAAVERHEEHRRVVLARIDAEQRAAADANALALKARRDAMIAFFQSRGSVPVIFRGRQQSCLQLGQAFGDGAAFRDADGYLRSAPLLEELESLAARMRASETVGA
jgi:hypothetical protein